ncbi:MULTISPECIES: PspC domain-containing protein [unclassified Butyrivibrio]|uniref:PspC domain-containing protein n=1 Tax=unclassified Butyrivibrio TaxID=2639466 RepID=UPI0004173DC7|nr:MULTISPECIES: PspC domain-containing protein [unclassified Butyrivibrio]
MGKRLYKSRDKKICGVCGGLAEYFGIDPTIVRLIYLLLVLFGGVGILPYIIAAIIMDDNPEGVVYTKKTEDPVTYANPEKDPVYESDEPVGFKVEDAVNDGKVKGFDI